MQIFISKIRLYRETATYKCYRKIGNSNLNIPLQAYTLKTDELHTMSHGQICMMHPNTFRNLGFQQADMGNKNGAFTEKTIVGVAQV